MHDAMHFAKVFIASLWVNRGCRLPMAREGSNAMEETPFVCATTRIAECCRTKLQAHNAPTLERRAQRSELSLACNMFLGYEKADCHTTEMEATPYFGWDLVAMHALLVDAERSWSHASAKHLLCEGCKSLGAVRAA